MSLISTSVLQGLTDRLAAQGALFNAAIAGSGLAGGGECFDRVSATETYEVERDLITPCRNWDKGMSGTDIFGGLSTLRTLMSSLGGHVATVGSLTMDQYLTRSGVNVANTFADMYSATTNVTLSSVNVFSEVDVEMGSVAHLGSDVWAFTDGTALGTGSGAYSATNHAAQQLLAYLGSGVTVAGNITVTATLKKEDGTTGTNTVAFTAADPANTHKVIGSASDQYIDIVNLTAASSGLTGTPTIFVRQIRERVPGL
jgi:hypothetical protein